MKFWCTKQAIPCNICNFIIPILLLDFPFSCFCCLVLPCVFGIWKAGKFWGYRHMNKNTQTFVLIEWYHGQFLQLVKNLNDLSCFLFYLYEHYERISCWLRCTFSLPAGRICILKIHMVTNWQTSKFSAGWQAWYKFFKINFCNNIAKLGRGKGLHSDICYVILCML